MNSLLTERDAAVLTLTINRPERRNALDTATYDALAAQLRAADADTGLAAVILTGAGDHFTAGNDLRDFQAERAAGDSPALRFLRALVDTDVPVLAAVEGHAVGVGVTLLQHCDFAFAAGTARLRMPFVALGLCPEGLPACCCPGWPACARPPNGCCKGAPSTRPRRMPPGCSPASPSRARPWQPRGPSPPTWPRSRARRCA